MINIRDNYKLTAADAVPQDHELASKLKGFAKEYCQDNKLCPPLSFSELHSHALLAITKFKIELCWLPFFTVLLGNENWHSYIAKIPFERRLFLLPQCLQNKESCLAEEDALGLLCADCGACAITELQNLAEDLGYVVLVAEGNSIVARLLEEGKVEAVVGVSCLDALERNFSIIFNEAVPALAYPLSKDGCENTLIDIEAVKELLMVRTPQSTIKHISLNEQQEELKEWFTPSELRKTLKLRDSETELLAFEWLRKHGKRWRPRITLHVFNELSDKDSQTIRHLALAVECFHKASLVHDDIEDDDELRYKEATLHCQYGVPIAINSGDLLLAWGYQLIADSALSLSQKVALLKVASQGHADLCLGQGKELIWMRTPQLLSKADLLYIFRYKTAPAFEVALLFAAIAADAPTEISYILRNFSMNLGIAYQIKDDLDDFADGIPQDISKLPSMISALATESATIQQLEIIKDGYAKKDDELLNCELRKLIIETSAIAQAEKLYKEYQAKSLQALATLRTPQLKILLVRLTNRIIPQLNDK